MKMNWYKVSQEDYRGIHTAPAPRGNNSLDNPSDIYPSDIYGPNGVIYYGDRVPYDNESMSVIQAARGNPNYRVKIYRAVPDVNAKRKKEINEYQHLISYFNKYQFFPVGNDIISKIEDKYPIGDSFSYDDKQKAVYNELVNIAQELDTNKKPNIGIYRGDWVSLSPTYVKEHGKRHLDDYRIATKVVTANQLYTEGESIHEWGYYP